MSSIIVRGLDEQVKERLRRRAADNGRSMEAEARDILTQHVMPHNIGLDFLDVGYTVGGVELHLERRSDPARAAELE